jgi:plasmid stabilization system protein ParE
MTYRFLTPALAEIREAAEFYEERVSGLGADFLDEVDATIDRMLQFPEAWGRLGEEFRKCHLRRFPYSIIYSVQSDQEIVIVSVFHQSREPRSSRRICDGGSRVSGCN